MTFSRRGDVEQRAAYCLRYLDVDIPKLHVQLSEETQAPLLISRRPPPLSARWCWAAKHLCPLHPTTATKTSSEREGKESIFLDPFGVDFVQFWMGVRYRTKVCDIAQYANKQIFISFSLLISMKICFNAWCAILHTYL